VAADVAAVEAVVEVGDDGEVFAADCGWFGGRVSWTVGSGLAIEVSGTLSLRGCGGDLDSG